MKKIDYLMEKLNRISKSTWILLAIIIVGVFLRTYHFHAWLNFENDQSRDAILVSDVLAGKTPWPLLGPTMRGSYDAGSNLFHLGPMYYYFQIISGKIFGNYPDKLAYPDLIFSLLTIPLFYLFMKKYFSLNLSLVLTGLFSISFFAIKYARFAWNPNSIPFFTLIFLLALYELVVNGEKARWKWVFAAGAAVGIGVQLHVILLVLFPVMLFLVFIYLLKENWRIWKKLALIIFIVMALNLSQGIGEMRSGFSNAKVFLNSATAGDSVAKNKNGMLEKAGTELNCQMEANAHILSSFGSDTCRFSFKTVGAVIERVEQNKKIKKTWNGMDQPAVAVNLLCGLVFSLMGYGLFIYRAWKETDRKKKIFLRLIGLYAALSFIVMLPLAEKFAEFRYFSQVFFMPFLLLGLLSEFLARKVFQERLVPVIIIIFFVVTLTNVNSVLAAGKDLSAGKRSDKHFAVLGEMELMVRYIISASGTRKDINIVGDDEYAAHFSQDFYYLAEKEGVNLFRIKDDDKKLPLGSAIFYLTDAADKKGKHIGGYSVASCKTFGKVAIYGLNGI